MPSTDPFSTRPRTQRPATGRLDTSEEYRDLCSNCDNGDACRGRTRPRRPVFFCEEFVIFGAEPAPGLDRSAEEKPRETWSANGHVGLCVNCDNVPTCVMPKPEGGVWHCEEYR